MKTRDLDRERCEKVLTMKEFMVSYNEGLPEHYPVATQSVLRIFTKVHPHFFKREDEWSLDQHRKRVMDWLPSQVRKEADV